MIAATTSGVPTARISAWFSSVIRRLRSASARSAAFCSEMSAIWVATKPPTSTARTVQEASRPPGSS